MMGNTTWLEPHVTAISALNSTEGLYREMLASAELHWFSSGFATALPLLLQALALSRRHNLQSLTSEMLLHLAFTQLVLGIPEQALVLVRDVLESVLAHGSLIDKGRALLLAVRWL